MKRDGWLGMASRMAATAFLCLAATRMASAQTTVLDKDELWRRVEERTNRLTESIDVHLNLSTHTKVDVAPDVLAKITELRRKLREGDMQRSSSHNREYHRKLMERTAEEFRASVDRQESHEIRYCTDGARWRLESRCLTPSQYGNAQWISNRYAPTIHTAGPGGSISRHHGYDIDQADRWSIFDGETGWHLGHVTDSMRRIIETNMTSEVVLIEHAAQIDEEGRLYNRETSYGQWFEPSLFSRPAAITLQGVSRAEGEPDILILSARLVDTNVEYYVDTSKDYAITKAIGRHGDEQVFSWEAAGWSLKQGIWYPASVEVKCKERSSLWNFPGAREVSPEKQADVTMVFEVASVDFKPRLSEDEFTPKFPANTRFLDLRFMEEDGGVPDYTSAEPIEGAAAVNALAAAALGGAAADLSSMLEDMVPEVPGEEAGKTPEPEVEAQAPPAPESTPAGDADGGGKVAPVIVAALVCIVVLAGIWIVFIRPRRAR